jgi:hypothetical protein
MKRLFGTSLVALSTMLASVAPAETTKQQCIDANVKGQDLRRDGKLAAAREQLQACAAPSCPALIRDDCARRLDDVNKLQPTIVFVAKDGVGQDVAGVTVAVDGKPQRGTLDGTELQVDPGAHVFKFTAPGKPPIDRTFVLALGEKDRREQLVVDATPVSPTPAPPAHPGHLVVTTGEAGVIAVDGQVVAKGRLDASEVPGPHDLLITAQGMVPYKAQIDLKEGETRTLEVSLQAEHRTEPWPWIAGGAVVVAGAIVGGYFLFKSSPSSGPAPPPDPLGSAQLSVFR